MGDPTIIRVGEEYHLFAEQSPASWGGDVNRGFAGVRTVCHAVSKNLFEWEELPNTICCGPEGSFDAYSIYHMDVMVHEGVWHMFYTGLDGGGPGQQQAIGLATSRDGLTWQKHPANPILRADPRWYEPAIPREATYQEKDFGRLWFRDPCVIRDPRTGRFGMIVVARDTRHHPDVRGCLAWATSEDLVRWEPRPPIYSPGRFHTIETPSLFEHGGRWYIQFMTAPHWGTPLLMTDPYQDAGDFYAVSESGPEGPYLRPPDEVVVAAHRDVRMGASRTVAGPDGERYFYGWLRLTPAEGDAPSRRPWKQVLPPPRRVRFLHDGQMQVVYHEGIERYASPLPSPDLRPVSAADHWRLDGRWTGKRFDGPSMVLSTTDHGDVVFSAHLRFLRGERAGVVLRSEATGSVGWQVVADRRLQRVEFGLLGSERFVDARHWTQEEQLDLKVVAYQESVEVYADDRLMIHQVRHRETSGALGLLVERAEAEFGPLRLMRFR